MNLRAEHGLKNGVCLDMLQHWSGAQSEASSHGATTESMHKETMQFDHQTFSRSHLFFSWWRNIINGSQHSSTILVHSIQTSYAGCSCLRIII